MKDNKEFKLTLDVIEDCLEESLEKIVINPWDKHQCSFDVY